MLYTVSPSSRDQAGGKQPRSFPFSKLRSLGARRRSGRRDGTLRTEPLRLPGGDARPRPAVTRPACGAGRRARPPQPQPSTRLRRRSCRQSPVCACVCKRRVITKRRSLRTACQACCASAFPGTINSSRSLRRGQVWPIFYTATLFITQ